ncbi:G5 domain-containing protein [bacterium]|nr:G5 domain-containing protein [bacterium]
MKISKLVILTSTICLSLLLPVVLIGINPKYTHAYNDRGVADVSNILLNFNTQESNHVFDLSLVTVVINGRSTQVLTNREDALSLLKDLGVVVDNSKRIVSISQEVQAGSVIRVITVGTVVEGFDIDIPFQTEKINTKDIPYGDTLVTQKGVLGVRTQEIERVYEDGKLVSEVILSERISRESVKEVVKVGVLSLGIGDLEKTYGYNCTHWRSVVNSGNYTEREKEWLNFVMYCESGCNAESDKNSTYKGLYQWHPKYWSIFYPKDNIYDGYAQIKNTIIKIRKGAKLYSYWPSCHRKYVAKYGEYDR